MRVAFSLFVSSLVFGSLAFDRQAMVISSSGSHQLLSLQPKSKPRSNKPEDATPQRGSGRRLIESSNNIHTFV